MMELVYLWVEKYKNIKNQGFNFSPRFTCKYDEATKELTIEKKKITFQFFLKISISRLLLGKMGVGRVPS